MSLILVSLVPICNPLFLVKVNYFRREDIYEINKENFCPISPRLCLGGSDCLLK